LVVTLYPRDSDTVAYLVVPHEEEVLAVEEVAVITRPEQALKLEYD
jgi:hypothetical protein